MLEKRTDLAVEAHEMYTKSENISKVEGVQTNTCRIDGVTVTRVKITTPQAGKVLKKPVGNYVTLEISDCLHNSRDNFDSVKKVLSNELKRMLPKDGPDSTILVVGLGNRHITADALGPKVVDGLLVTRHLFELMPEELENGISPVCALSPGVLGLTGIETGEIIRGVTDRVKPDVIIAIDALASRSISRVMTTIQLSDTGITPGAGIGNARAGISEETLNVPVIAIGVPTVVDAATMANDTIDMVIDTIIHQTKSDSKIYDALQSLDKNEKYHLIDEVLNQSFTNLVVTPKEVDEIIDDLAEIISDGINICVHSCINTKNAQRYS